MNCQEAQDRLVELLSETLPPALRGDLEAHLSACAACRAERERLDRQERQLREHFQALRGLGKAKILSLPERRRPGVRAWAAAAAVLLVAGFWLLRPEGGPPPAYGDVKVVKQGFTVTVFNEDLALVKDRRQILNLRPGVNRFRFEDVPGRLDPSSVRFRSETDPEGCKVLEQNFEYDLVSQQKLLRKYVDREIGFERLDPKTEVRQRLKGTLLSPEGAVRTPSGEVLTAFPGAAVLPELPEGLLTRPALAWALEVPRERQHETTVSYLTGGMAWHADYIATLTGAKTLDLDGWVTVTNESGAGFPDAQLKLVAGDVHRMREEVEILKYALEEAEKCEQSDKGFQEKSFFEYHLYTLDRSTTLRDRETKQISLLGAKGVPYGTELVYEPARDPRVQRFLVFKNTREANLGMPLPAGSLRLRAIDRDGEAEQVSFASIEHTPKGEEVRIPRGADFDLVGERTLRQTLTLERRVVHEVEIRLRNHGEEPAAITVLERLEGDWSITQQSHPHQKKDAATASFGVEVPAGGETVIRYTWERQANGNERPIRIQR